MGFYVPQIMRAARRWVLWDDKKIPYRADGKGKANPTEPDTWADYDAAILTLDNSDFKGVGFVFAPGDNLVFIDLDNCIDEAGELTETAQSILDLFPNTYTEYSQSETGLHIIARGVLPCTGRRIAGVMEIYAAGRYMAFTGNAYTTAEPTEAQTAINELCSRYNITADTTTPATMPTTPATASRFTDEELITRCYNAGGSNWADFRALWAGDWSKYEAQGKSQSEADYRLLEILYFYSGSREQAARLFLQSPLGQRIKTQRVDYVTRTLKAIAEKNTPQNGPQRARQGRANRGQLTDTPKPQKKYRQF